MSKVYLEFQITRESAGKKRYYVIITKSIHRLKTSLFFED